MSSKELFDKKFVNVMWDDSLEGKEGFFADYIDTLIERVNNNIRGTVVERVNSITGTVDTQLVFGFCSYGAASFPFLLNGTHYRFFYYDPNYSCKRAYMEGKVIQFRNNSSDSWIVVSSPNWVDRCEYRVKPENTEKTTMSWRCEDCVYEERDFREEPCSECVVIASGNKGSNWEPKKKHKKKRRWTNRELAQWVWQGNGQVKNRGGYFTLVHCTAYDVRDDDKPCPDYFVVRGWNETEWHEPEVEE